ncbi:hypothetical protein [Asticcacaulis sp. YBE204]|uniref:hypothetical protein n=1 Tax=Asticcacaulis sp. YBE204 TaxID=1282363 RepID=UPI0003C3FC91|nr:hypothetical protein [Asticcacaulis sp. YBE204]ESQ80541.1 hypothetical protein AEYBE204_04540 [Asticcacaulis sp. YBE204]
MTAIRYILCGLAASAVLFIPIAGKAANPYDVTTDESRAVVEINEQLLIPALQAMNEAMAMAPDNPTAACQKAKTSRTLYENAWQRLVTLKAETIKKGRNSASVNDLSDKTAAALPTVIANEKAICTPGVKIQSDPEMLSATEALQRHGQALNNLSKQMLDADAKGDQAAICRIGRLITIEYDGMSAALRILRRIGDERGLDVSKIDAELEKGKTLRQLSDDQLTLCPKS